MDLINRFNSAQPNTAKIKGGPDKTPIEADGGLNLSKDEAKIKKAGGRELGNGGAGYNNIKPYSSTNPK
jgi:hypothetical protein